jgi:hypothetical protein
MSTLLSDELTARGAPARTQFETNEQYLEAIDRWRDSLDEILRLHLFTRMLAVARMLD